MIPLAVTYSGKVTELISNPPLLPISQLNILHAQGKLTCSMRSTSRHCR